MSRTTALYQRLVVSPRTKQSRQEQDTVARNGLLQLSANFLQGCGDQVVNAKTVLPWLLGALGAPAGITAFLVPIRESGSMLPQAMISPWVQRQPRSTPVWLLGALGQAVAVAAMALIAAFGAGWLAGVGIVVSLAVFSLARSLCSLAGKDVLGRTIPKGERGQINGMATTLAGVVAIGLGLALRLFTDSSTSTTVLALLLGGASALWIASMLVYSRIQEPAHTPAQSSQQESWWKQAKDVLASDATFRRFVIARTLLLVSALSPPFIVTLAATQSDVGLAGLGPFVLAQGVANLVGGRIFGKQADRSSRKLMMWTAIAASGTVGLFLVAYALWATSSWIYPLTYLVLALIHAGVRVARKTYVVDIAEGTQRTQYVAVSNTIMGLLLLGIGAVSGAIAMAGETVALGFLALLGLVGAFVSTRLPEVSH